MVKEPLLQEKDSYEGSVWGWGRAIPLTLATESEQESHLLALVYDVQEWWYEQRRVQCQERTPI